jgi:GNAT superfamily N-acetyltransferase
MLVALRPAAASELDFSYAVTEAAMRTYVEQTWGIWDIALQQEKCRTSCELIAHQIVLVDGARAGIVAVAIFESHVQLEKLYLLPRFQGRGVGTRIMASLLESAATLGKPVHLRVLRVDEGARRFYRRHGFIETHATSERFLMQTPPTT